MKIILFLLLWFGSSLRASDDATNSATPVKKNPLNLKSLALHCLARLVQEGVVDAQDLTDALPEPLQKSFVECYLIHYNNDRQYPEKWKAIATHVTFLDLVKVGRAPLPTLTFYCSHESSELNLAWLQLSELNVQLPVVSIVRLNGNKLTTFNSTLLSPCVAVLHLGNNTIKELPDLHYLESLHILSLPENELTTLDPAKLPPFRIPPGYVGFLNLSHNQFSQVPNLRDKGITKLSLAYNQIDSIESQHCPPLLEELDLSHNQLTVAPALHDLTALKCCSLEGNRIMALASSQLPKNLITLNVKDNDLRVLELRNNNKLQAVDLSNNPELFVADLYQEGESALTELKIMNNPNLKFICLSLEQFKKLMHIAHPELVLNYSDEQLARAALTITVGDQVIRIHKGPPDVSIYGYQTMHNICQKSKQAYDAAKQKDYERLRKNPVVLGALFTLGVISYIAKQVCDWKKAKKKAEEEEYWFLSDDEALIKEKLAEYLQQNR
jgi:Leucine-rich repeat (LRR) protein